MEAKVNNTYFRTSLKHLNDFTNMQAYLVKFKTDVYIRGIYRYIKLTPKNKRIFNRHFINSIRHSNMFQNFKDHLLGV